MRPPAVAVFYCALAVRGGRVNELNDGQRSPVPEPGPALRLFAAGGVDCCKCEQIRVRGVGPVLLCEPHTEGRFRTSGGKATGQVDTFDLGTLHDLS
jgi:hypothetical protein